MFFWSISSSRVSRNSKGRKVVRDSWWLNVNRALNIILVGNGVRDPISFSFCSNFWSNWYKTYQIFKIYQRIIITIMQMGSGRYISLKHLIYLIFFFKKLAFFLLGTTKCNNVICLWKQLKIKHFIELSKKVNWLFTYTYMVSLWRKMKNIWENWLEKINIILFFFFRIKR